MGIETKGSRTVVTVTPRCGPQSYEGVMKDEPIDDPVGFGNVGGPGNGICW